MRGWSGLWGLVDMLEPDLNGTGFGDWLTAMAMVMLCAKRPREDGGKGMHTCSSCALTTCCNRKSEWTQKVHCNAYATEAVKTLFPAPVVTATYSGTVCGMGGISPREETCVGRDGDAIERDMVP